MKFLNQKIGLSHLILALILFVIFLLRLPSLFEPFWYGDEGIFAAVARNLNLGGILYQTAWDNKPPMIYLTYAAIFKYMGVSMFSLRLVTSIFVLATSAAIYEIANSVLGQKRALLAALVFGVLSSARVIEGNLALTEIFMILPITLAMMVAVKRNFDSASLFCAGLLFAFASLFKQVGAFETVALGIFLFFISKNWLDFIKRGVFLTVGFVIPYAVTIGYFSSRHLLSDYIFAAYTFYRIYLSESPKYAKLINVLKYLPILSAIFYAVWKKHGFKIVDAVKLKKGKDIGIFHLLLLWCAFSFLGSYFSGRAYGHYLVQATPALALLVASLGFEFKFKREQLIFGLVYFGALIFLTRLLFVDFISGGRLNQLDYYKNFIEFAQGKKNLMQYNDYFDRNVNTIDSLADFFASNKLKGTSTYIWGDISWLYAISDLKNPSKYVTSFHVFEVPNGKAEVAKNLQDNAPNIIIKMQKNIGYFTELENLISSRYTLVLQIGDSKVYIRSQKTVD